MPAQTNQRKIAGRLGGTMELDDQILSRLS
jgi:hypothetical protein